jgi:hypothetical protein
MLVHGERCILHNVALAIECVDVGEHQQLGRLGAFRMTAWLRRQRRRSAADIDLLHGAAPARIIGGAVDQHFAFVHHRHAIGEREDAIDIVLDQQDRNIGRDSLDQLRDAFALGGGQPCERLIEEKHARPARQGQSHIEQPLPAVGKETRLRALDP